MRRNIVPRRMRPARSSLCGLLGRDVIGSFEVRCGVDGGADRAYGVAGTALVDEESEPSEWGDPGHCVRRRAMIELHAGTMVGAISTACRARFGSGAPPTLRLPAQSAGLTR